MQEDKTKSRKLNMQLERQNENSKIRHAGRQNEKTTCRTTQTKSRKDEMQDDKNEKSKKRHAGRQNEKTTCRTTKTKSRKDDKERPNL